MRRLAGIVLRIGLCGMLAWCLTAGSAAAGSGAADGTFTITMTKVEISKDGGATFTTLFSGSQQINIAAANAGAVAAGLVSGATLEAGTYTVVRVTIGDTLVVKGYVNDTANGETEYTNNDADGFGTGAGLDTTSGDGTYQTSTFTIPVANRVSDESLSMTIAPGKSPTCQVKFNTSAVIALVGGFGSIAAPDVSTTTR